jgi:hypothetical protein
MASGDLPSGPPLIERPGTHSVVNSFCGDPGPQVALLYSAGLMVRVFAACDPLWQQERQTA